MPCFAGTQSNKPINVSYWKRKVHKQYTENPMLPYITPPTPLAPWFVVNFCQASGVLWPVLVPFGLYQYDCWWLVCRPCGYICFSDRPLFWPTGFKGLRPHKINKLLNQGQSFQLWLPIYNKPVTELKLMLSMTTSFKSISEINSFIWFC